jgi:hypothetical protein
MTPVPELVLGGVAGAVVLALLGLPGAAILVALGVQVAVVPDAAAVGVILFLIVGVTSGLWLPLVGWIMVGGAIGGWLGRGRRAKTWRASSLAWLPLPRVAVTELTCETASKPQVGDPACHPGQPALTPSFATLGPKTEVMAYASDRTRYGRCGVHFRSCTP